MFSLLRYNNKTYRIDDIDWDKTPASTFEMSRGGREGSQISYVDYYQQVSCRCMLEVDLQKPPQTLGWCFF